MKLKRLLSGALVVALLFSFPIPAYADDVNIDNILHGDSNRVGRYKHTGNDWGWIVECYVATSESGKLDTSKSLLDGSNAAYLGRVVFTSSGASGRVPAMQRPAAIQTNGGGETPQLADATRYECSANGYPDPFSTGSAQLQKDFQTASQPLSAFWNILGGNLDGSRTKVYNALHPTVKEKVKATGGLECLDPSLPNNPVEYAFVLTPLVYIMIDTSINSSCNWNEQFWMGANESGVLNRYSKVKAAQDLNTFIERCAASGANKDPNYTSALAILQLRVKKGELADFANMSHLKLPDSAYLDHPQFGIGTPNRGA